MNKPSVGGEPSDIDGSGYFTSFAVAARIQQPSFVVTRQEWNRIKERVRNIRSRESHWLSALSVLSSMGVSFLISAVSLVLEGVATWVTIGFAVATAIGVSGAIVCWFAYKESRGRREYYIKIVIEDMDAIERLYES